MDRNFWRDKKVLVTGHTGFKGSWLSLWMQALGVDVVGYSLPPVTDPSLFETARVAEGMETIEADIRNLDRLKAEMKRHAPDIVIHMAAQALVHTAYADPVRTFSTNVMGTLNVLEAVKETDSTRVIIAITSDKCYENREWVWGYRENDRMGGHDPYSSSKGCAELLIAAYRNSYFHESKVGEYKVSLASARAGNVIGGGDWSRDRLIPDVMKAILAGEAVPIRRPTAVRPWQFVMEPLRGYIELAERLWIEGSEFAEAWNFGPDIEQIQPVDWIAEHLTKRWGNGARWKLDEAEYPSEDNLLKLDCAKSKSRLGWKPFMPLSTVLDWIVDWFQEYHRGGSMREVTLQQIRRYENLIREQQ